MPQQVYLRDQVTAISRSPGALLEALVHASRGGREKAAYYLGIAKRLGDSKMAKTADYIETLIGGR
jgi:hypothetical protein